VPGSDSWWKAFQTGERLAAEGKFAEAIPHYRMGITQQGASDWRTHYALALALRNPSVRDTVRLGLRIPEMRSSYDRVDTSREALDELTVALGLARRPEDIAFIGRLVAQIYANWGYVWDPFFIYRQSEPYDATGECARISDAFLDRMRDPVGAR